MITFQTFSPFTEKEKTGLERLSAAPAGGADSFLAVLAKSVARIGEYVVPGAPAAVARPAPVVTDRDGVMNEAIRFVLDHEGSAYVAVDGGRESSRYGILQGTAERLGFHGSVRNMSQDQARAVYRKLWAESGCQDLPPRLAIVHFDTYVNSPAAARRILKASGGDTDTYLKLRSDRYSRLAVIRPGRYARYMKGWTERIHDLRATAAVVGPSLAKASS